MIARCFVCCTVSPVHLERLSTRQSSLSPTSTKISDFHSHMLTENKRVLCRTALILATGSRNLAIDDSFIMYVSAGEIRAY